MEGKGVGEGVVKGLAGDVGVGMVMGEGGCGRGPGSRAWTRTWARAGEYVGVGVAKGVDGC